MLCNWLKKLSKVNISVILYFVVGGHSTTTSTKILSNFDYSSEQLMTFYMIPTLFGISTDPLLLLVYVVIDPLHEAEKIFIRYNFQFPGDFKNNVTICDLSSNEEGAGKIQCKAPKYEDAPIACMALHPKTKTLFVVYSNHHFVECCTKTGKYTKLTMTLLENEELIPKVPSIYYVITFIGEWGS